MKRLTAVFILAALGAMLFASTSVSFSGRYALVGSNGRTIRRTTSDIEKDGVVLATGEERAKAISSSYTLSLGENSLSALKSDDGLTIYLVYGYATVVSNGEKNITVYTPTTRTEITTKGEYCFISTNDEEKIYNFSSPAVGAYDAIRGKTIDVGPNKGFDYLKNRIVEADENMRYLDLPIYISTPQFVPTVLTTLSGTPDIAEFLDVVQEMTGTPEAPVITDPETILVLSPEAPVILDNIVQKLIDSSFTSITVTRELVEEGD
ncbi:MAG: hypothetical protein ACI4S4_04030 [Candidatus Ornithospirochaeta sp.]